MRAFEFLTEYRVKGLRAMKYRDGGKPEWYEKAVQLKTDNPRMSASEIGRQVGVSFSSVLLWLTGQPDGKGRIYNDNPPFTQKNFPNLSKTKYFDGEKPEWYEEAIAMRKQGMTWSAIANKVSTPEKKVMWGSVHAWLVKGRRHDTGKLVNPDAPFEPRAYGNKNKFSQVEKLVKELIDADYTDKDIIEWIKQDTPKLALAVKEKLPQLRAEMKPQAQVRDKVTGQDITGFVQETS